MKRYHFLICSLALVLVTGCTQQKSPTGDMNQDDEVTSQQVGEKLGEAAQAAGQYSKQKVEEFLGTAQKQFDDAKQKTSQLREKVAKLQESAQAGLQQRVEQLEKKLNDAEQQLNQARNASGDAWAKAQDNLQKSLDNLETAYKEAIEEFDKASSGGEKKE